MAANGTDGKLSRDEVEIVVRQCLKSKDFRLVGYQLRPASESPLGFLGDHLKLRTVVERDGSENEERHFFVKAVPSSLPQHTKYALATRAFFKEIELYRTLFADIREAQEKPTKWCPDYFFSRGEELVVVEDLSVEGYYMLPERTLMDEDHIRASLRAMAAMHAGSLVLQEKLRKGAVTSLSPNYKKYRERTDVTLGQLYSHLTYETEVSDIKGHPGNTFMEVGFKSQIPVVDLLEGYTHQEKTKIKEKLPHALRRILPLVKPSDKYQNVFIHGDLWSNNLLFRKGKDGKVQDSIIIDFQLARYAPPAHDIMMFLYLVQDRNFREKKEPELFDYYYEFLSKELSRNGVSAAAVLPKNVFLESCEFYRELGVISSVLYFQLIIASPEAVEKFMESPESYEKIMLIDRSEMIIESFEKDKEYRRRMSEAMKELIQRHILP
ncbi:UNVERIFIED_CONTAM: hypothetical protein PYX00_003999 [Menopon gallinae]